MDAYNPYYNYFDERYVSFNSSISFLNLIKLNAIDFLFSQCLVEN